MRKLAEIRDFTTLRQAAFLLENATVQLTKENAELKAEIARLRGLDVDPQTQILLLQERLNGLQQEVYGPSSEKRPRAKVDTDTEPPPRRGHGPRSQPDLPLEVVTHGLPEDERTCGFCGGHLEEMGDQAEESEEITVVGVEYKLVTHRRQKYRCRCNAQVVTAPGPAKLVPGGRYSVDLAVHVAEQKYLDHLPLERQARAMGRAGLQVDSQTLWDQLDALAGHLEPTYEALLAKVLESDVVFADETHWPNHDGGGTSRWWAWCAASDELATYRILPSRSQAAAGKLLNGFGGVVMTDGYGAYQALERAGPGITLAHCWAHVRRKYLEGSDAYPGLGEHAVARIGELFALEQEMKRAGAGAALLERRARLRAERSRPIVEGLLRWAVEQRGAVMPGSKMGRAIAYMLKLWPGLTRFLDDPRVPLDNNAAERALRGVVVGRKNHYGSRSRRGTEVAALFYTLFESAKLSQADPRAYVRQAAVAAITEPGAVTLPSDLA